MRSESAAPGDSAARRFEAQAALAERALALNPAAASTNSPLDQFTTATLVKARALAADETALAGAVGGAPDLELACALAALRSPKVAAAERNYQAVLHRIEQAAYLEDIVGQYRAFTRELDVEIGPTLGAAMPSETFPFPSTFALKGEAARAEADIARIDLEAARREAMNEAARAFFELLYTTDALRLMREDRALYADIREGERSQLEAGRASQSASLGIEGALALLESGVYSMERERATAAARLNAVLRLPPGAEWGPPRYAPLDAVALPLNDPTDLAEAGSQSARRARRMADLARLLVRLAETMVYPSAATTGGPLALSDSAEAGATRGMMNDFPTSPQPDAMRAGFGPNAAYIDELRLRVGEADAMAAQAETEAAYNLRRARLDAERAWRELQTYEKTAGPRARQAYAATQELYKSGQASFIEWVETGRAQLDTTLKTEKARHAYHMAIIDYEDALGRPALQALGACASHEHPSPLDKRMEQP